MSVNCRLWAAAVAATTLAACSSGGDDEPTFDRCLGDVIEESAAVAREYRNGELTGADKTFVDQNGIDATQMIIAEQRVRDRDPQCDDAMPKAGEGSAPR